MTRNVFLVVLTFGVLNLTSVRQAIESQSKAHSGNSVRERFIGAWELQSAEFTMKDGTKRPYPDLGADGRGYLMYTADGHMCAQLVNPKRPTWKNPLRPTDAEKVAAMDGLTAYCGRFEVDESKRIMTHYPEVAWKPNFEGTTQPRPYAFNGDLLTFSDKEDEEPGAVSYSIVW